MSAWEDDAYRLASEIEWINAKARARLKVGQGRPRWAFKDRVAAEYDPHAATELGALIVNRLARSALQQKGGGNG